MPENGEVGVFLKASDYIAEIDCQPGYILQGLATLKCQKNMQWQFGM